MIRILYIFLLILSFLLMTLYDLYGAFLLAVLLAAVPLLSALFGRLAGKHLSVSLTLPQKARRKESVSAVLTVSGKAVPFLGGLRVRPADRFSEKPTLSGKGISFSVPVFLPHCGRILTKPMRVEWTDPFGLLSFHRKLARLPLLVLPEKAGREDIILQSLSRLQSADETEHFGATEYKPGDNPHLINWKITARTEDVYVRDTWPAESDSLILAADYEKDGDLRDIVADALYSVGSALTGAHRAFRFAWSTEKGVPVLETIRTGEDWQRAVSAFLSSGGDRALETASFNPTVPLLYLTGNPDPPVPPSLSPVIWCASEGSRRAALSGKSALESALGGRI